MQYSYRIISDNEDFNLREQGHKKAMEKFIAMGGDPKRAILTGMGQAGNTQDWLLDDSDEESRIEGLYWAVMDSPDRKVGQWLSRNGDLPDVWVGDERVDEKYVGLPAAYYGGWIGASDATWDRRGSINIAAQGDCVEVFRPEGGMVYWVENPVIAEQVRSAVNEG